MEINKESWARYTLIIWIGILLVDITGILRTILLKVIGSNPHLLNEAATGVISIFIVFGQIIGFILMPIGLSAVKNICAKEDAKALGLLVIGHIIMLVGVIFNMLTVWPVFGILSIASTIIIMIGLYSLKWSKTFPYKATKGAGMLFGLFIVAIIAGFISGVFDIIPIWSNETKLTVTLIFVIMCNTLEISAWYQVKSADTEDFLAKYTEQEKDVQPAPVQERQEDISE